MGQLKVACKAVEGLTDPEGSVTRFIEAERVFLYTGAAPPHLCLLPSLLFLLLFSYWVDAGHIYHGTQAEHKVPDQQF